MNRDNNWNNLKDNIRRRLGYSISDMDIDSIEDEVNRLTDKEYAIPMKVSNK